MATSSSKTSKADGDKSAIGNNASLADVKPEAAENNRTLADVTGGDSIGATDGHENPADPAPVADPGPGGPIPVYDGSAPYASVTAAPGTVANADAERNDK